MYPINLFFLFLFLILAGVAAAIETVWTMKNWQIKLISGKARAAILSLLFIGLAAASWICNMGWLRLITMMLFLPFLHAIMFLVMNLSTAAYKTKSRTLQRLNLFFCITYVAFNLFLPDGAMEKRYFFFGLVQSSFLSRVAGIIAMILLVVHILLFILQIIQIFQIKKQDTVCGHNDSL